MRRRRPSDFRVYTRRRAPNLATQPVPRCRMAGQHKNVFITIIIYYTYMFRFARAGASESSSMRARTQRVATSSWRTCQVCVCVLRVCVWLCVCVYVCAGVCVPRESCFCCGVVVEEEQQRCRRRRHSSVVAVWCVAERNLGKKKITFTRASPTVICSPRRTVRKSTISN